LQDLLTTLFNYYFLTQYILEECHILKGRAAEPVQELGSISALRWSLFFSKNQFIMAVSQACCEPVVHHQLFGYSTEQ
jgi:hypothetical protein